MGTRKTIGVFVEGDDVLEEGVIADAIMEEARERDYNVLIFHSLMTKPPFSEGMLPDSIVVGEGAIYKLPDYDMLDGVIILGEVLRPDVTKDIVRRAQEKNLPIFNVNDTYDGCYHVNYNDVVGMKEMVLHLIRHHGCREINFISGFEGNKESEEREAAYRSALEEEGIPFEKERVSYGYFYLKSVDVIKEYLKDHELPDAIVCANDTMAIFVTKYLTDNGYHVPQDVIITGFDYTRDAADYQPSISSVARSLGESGRLAVELLSKVWDGEDVPVENFVPAHLVLNQSCGCAERTQLDLNRINQSKTNDTSKRDIFIHHITDMWRDLASMETIEGVLEVICRHLDFFEWDELNFCICSDIFGERNSEYKRIYDYSPDMTLVKYRRGEKFELEKVFYPKILPDLDLQGEERLQMAFIPMYLKQRTVGYVWIPMEHSMRDAPMVYAFLTTLNSAIIDFCLLNEKDELVNKLDSMYVRDELTKLYNRFGMSRYVKKIMEVARRDNKKIMCVALDLDGLKVINDTYGHEAGDNAIVQVANAMRQASERREICIRSGGDEYLVFGIVEQESDAAAFTERVKSCLREYNERNNWPYTVECSIGYCIHPADYSIEELVTEADKLLYKEKVRRKSLRTS